MTEREKIIEIIKQASEQAYADFHELFREGVKRVRDGEISRFTNRDVRPTHDEILADKLIEAGFGNVSDWKHRTGVAEKQVYCLARSFAEALCKNGNAENLIQGFIQDAQKQAERELAEEKKDENRI